MRILGNIKEKRQYYFHGGSPVLLLQTYTPTGDTPAALHLTRLVELLTDYTKERLLPPAVEAFTNMVREGQGYRFTPHRATIALKQAESSVTLTYSLFARGDLLWSRELTTHWDARGTIQYPAPPRPRQKAHNRKPRKG